MDWAETGRTDLVKTPTANMVANFLTKALTLMDFEEKIKRGKVSLPKLFL